MGVDGLWKMIKPTQRLYDLDDLSHINGYSVNNRENILKIGVDISTVMNECIAADHASHMYQHRSNGALRTFFEKLCKLLRKHVRVTFVFDGPLRPSFKRGKEINTHSVPEWKAPCQELIEACGFYWHQAPGEAKAELAMLNELGVIDAIITSDSDAFLFGAQCVLRSISGSELYHLYSMDTVENSTDIIEWPTSTVTTVSSSLGSLSRGGLILLALLSKNDYSNGLPGCGPTVAVSLVRCGFGDELLHAFKQLSGASLAEKLLAITRSIADELRSNSRGMLGSRYPGLASNLLSSNLLTTQAIGAFVTPIISSSPFPVWIERSANISQIASLCRGNFHWGPAILEKKLHNILWPAISSRLLLSPLMVYNNSQKKCYAPSTQAEILKVSVLERRNKSGRWARITLSAVHFFSQLGQDVSTPSAISKDSRILIWVPIECVPSEILEPPRPAMELPLENPSALTSQLNPLDSSLLSLVDQISVGPVANLDSSLASKKRRAEQRKRNRMEKKRRESAAAFEDALKQVAEISDTELDHGGASSSAPQKRKFSEAFPHDAEVIVISD